MSFHEAWEMSVLKPADEELVTIYVLFLETGTRYRSERVLEEFLETLSFYRAMSGRSNECYDPPI